MRRSLTASLGTAALLVAVLGCDVNPDGPKSPPPDPGAAPSGTAADASPRAKKGVRVDAGPASDR